MRTFGSVRRSETRTLEPSFSFLPTRGSALRILGAKAFSSRLFSPIRVTKISCVVCPSLSAIRLPRLFRTTNCRHVSTKATSSTTVSTRPHTKSKPVRQQGAQFGVVVIVAAATLRGQAACRKKVRQQQSKLKSQLTAVTVHPVLC